MKGNNNPFQAIQYYLYEHPLYLACQPEETELNLLIIGFDNFGEMFLDASLQYGQMRKKVLNVTVIAEDEVVKGAYLSKRPELSNFFDVDGSLTGCDDIYGRISFQIKQFDKTIRRGKIKSVKNLLSEQNDGKKPHYVFFSLGSDRINHAAAATCKDALDIGEKCIISYVCEQNEVPADLQADTYPLFVNADVKQNSLHADIERMAFNTHLVWEKNLNVDYNSVRADFRKEYNHIACISNVLSLKYKLHSMDIDLETVDFTEAAIQFRRNIIDKKKRNLKNELIWLEHRRWVTEKICAGWQRIENLEECATGTTKDEKRKRHVCILRSRPDRMLADESHANNFAKWNDPKADLTKLDELDAMSVKLHRMYLRKAAEVAELNLLSGSNMEAIKGLIEGNKKVFVAFQEWFNCLNNIWSGNKAMVRQYKGLRNAFLKAADNLPVERRNAIRENVKAFDALFYPVLACMEYRDWKQDDVALVENIPFILTYSEDICLAIPFATGVNNSVFGNVAAATVACPSKLLYLYYVEGKQSISELKDAIPYVAEYMVKKNFKANAELVLLYSSNNSAIITDELIIDITKIGNGRIKSVKLIEAESTEMLSEQLIAYLKQRSIIKKPFAVEKNETALSYILQGAGFYNNFPYYRFDTGSGKFYDISGCEMLDSIRKNPLITVADMISFTRSSSDSNNHPAFANDYTELWKKYQELSDAWKGLCKVLCTQSKIKDKLASLKIKAPKEKNTKSESHSYILPFMCIQSVSMIITFLIDKGILEKESNVSAYTADSCKVTLVDCCDYKCEYDNLLSKVYALMFPDCISTYVDTNSREAIITFDSLDVSGVKIGGKREEEIKTLLNFFCKKCYIINMTQENGAYSFTYATRKIKELLTTEGKILEVYTYHKIKELGAFDDVVCGYEVEWGDGTDVRSECDLLVTKGFRSLFIECKSRPEITQDYYYKLTALKNQFGINATAVLIADTKERPFYTVTPVNRMQRRRGNMMDVVTVWKPSEITDIGQTLLQIMDGTYMSKEEK